MARTLLITGAASDVGVELLKNIYSDYNEIFLQYRNINEALLKVVNEIKEDSKPPHITLLQSDFEDEARVDAMINAIEQTRHIPDHIIHLPAPRPYNQRFHKDNWENFDRGWDISVRSIVKILEKFIPHMSRQKYGRIIFMLTSCTKGSSAKFQSSYVTVKYALLGLMKSLSVEYADKGITVNGISPEMMDTKFISDLPELLIEQNRASSPLKRNVKLDEIIPIMLYMLSDAGAAMTGENIAITGGIIRH